MTIIAEYRELIAEIQCRIDSIQNACSNPPEVVTFKHGASTGNYCQQDDCYWTDFKCGLCEKQWREEGSAGSDRGTKVNEL